MTKISMKFEDDQREQLEALGCYKDGKLDMLDRDNLTEAEYKAILLCYSANTSIYSFAAEVQAHAMGQVLQKMLGSVMGSQP